MRVLFLLCSLLSLLSAVGAELVGKRPNIIFILTDDQGYGDVSAHGNPILKTPNLDRLHREGVRFTDFCVSPTCAPTRAALLTGRHEFRNGVTHTILERERLAPEAVTLPQLLQAGGYRTGIFGKWHLGDEADHQPDKRGFGEVFIHGAGGIGQSYPGSCGDAPGNTYFDPYILHNRHFEKTQGYCTDVFFAQAVRWIEQVKDQGPFYCHLATNAPHAPLQVRPEDEARYTGQVPAETAKYFGMVANIDDNVGRLLKRLAELGLEQNTLVIFMSDNGGTGGTKVFNAGMHGQKGSPWIGGTRAISFWRWPGTLVPHEVTALTAHLDFSPTLAEITAAPVPEVVRAGWEGRSLAPLLQDADAAWPERTLFTHVGRWPKGADRQQYKFTQCSVRTPRWHLVEPSRAAKSRAAWQLYDVQADPGELHDAATDQPDVVQTLSAAYDQWWASVQSGMVNEEAPGPAENPFATLFRAQVGGVPSPLPTR